MAQGQGREPARGELDVALLFIEGREQQGSLDRIRIELHCFAGEILGAVEASASGLTAGPLAKQGLVAGVEALRGVEGVRGTLVSTERAMQRSQPRPTRHALWIGRN